MLKKRLTKELSQGALRIDTNKPQSKTTGFR